MNKTASMHTEEIKVIVGLGNPGPRFTLTPHNIGFLVLDALADRYNGSWRMKDNMELAEIRLHDKKFLLVKPQTFMNESGRIMSYLHKQGYTIQNLLVIHDEIDAAFGVLKWKVGGSARGHNGLRSIIAHAGEQFLRLRFGVGRPVNREEVGDFVLKRFQELEQEVSDKIDEAIVMIEQQVA